MDNKVLIAFIIGEIAKTVPALAIDLILALKKEGTDEDWAELRKKWDKPADSFYQTPPLPM